jgi:hypothetical protein
MKTMRMMFVIVLAILIATVVSPVGAQENVCEDIGNARVCGTPEDVAAMRALMENGTQPETQINVTVDFYGDAEQAAVGGGIVGDLMGGQGGGDAAAAQAAAEEPFDPTRWSGDAFAVGYHWPEGEDPIGRDRDDAWFRIAEVANRLVDNGDDTYRLEPATGVYTTHALLFGNFAGIGVERGMISVPNEMRMLVDDVDGVAPERFSFSVKRDEFSFAQNGEAPWETLSGGTGYVIMQIGSLPGADVVIELDGQMAGYHVEGEYCDMCIVNTSVNGVVAQYYYESDDMGFAPSNADVTTTDVLTIFVPNDFREIRVTMANFGAALGDEPLASIWFGSGDPTQAPQVDQGGASASVVLDADTNIRTQPNGQGELIAVLPAGTTVELVAVPMNAPGFVIVDAPHPTNDELRIQGFISLQRAGNPDVTTLPEWATWQNGAYSPEVAG